MDFRDGNHAVCDAERNNIVEIADAATSVPYNSYAVRTSLCNFGDGLVFDYIEIEPKSHDVKLVAVSNAVWENDFQVRGNEDIVVPKAIQMLSDGN